MSEMSKEEKEYHELIINYTLAKNDNERLNAEKEFEKFEKEHPVLADEIQSRRWID